MNRLTAKLCKSFVRNENGASAIEFALIAPILITIIFGTLEAGYILFNRTTLQQGIERAGRYAMIHRDATTTEIKSEAISATKGLGKLEPTFTVSQETIEGIPYTKIAVSADYSLLTPIFTGKTFSMTSTVVVPQTDPEDFS